MRSDKRSALEALARKQGMAATATSLRWCHSGAQLSERMTKHPTKAQASYHLLLQRKTWKLVYDSNFVSEKNRKQKGLDTLEQSFAVDDDDAWQLLPADLEMDEDEDIPLDYRSPEVQEYMYVDQGVVCTGESGKEGRWSTTPVRGM